MNGRQSWLNASIQRSPPLLWEVNRPWKQTVICEIPFRRSSLLKKVALLTMTVFLVRPAKAQLQGSPGVDQVLLYSAIGSHVPGPTGAVPNVFTETVVPTVLGATNFGSIVTTPSNYSASSNLLQLDSALNASIATALSIIPLSSPASGVILRTDPDTGAPLPESSTLGTIFTERAETIGKRRFYVGFSHQDFHFTRFNGMSLNTLSVLYTGGDGSGISAKQGATGITTVPATFNIGMDVHLSQDITFFTYGVTDHFDVSVGVPVVHSGVAARTYDGTIYAGTGFGNPTCWCVNTFTPGSPTLELPQIGQAGLSKTGFGDLLLRLKGTVVRKRNVVVAVGGDVRFPTGNETNYLGTGTTSVKPFAAVSLYSKPVRNLVVFSPHFDFGWQFAGKSILGGELQPTTLTQSISGGQVTYLGAPFTTKKDFIPDVFSWAAGTEVALGHHNTVIVDILGNQIGWIHGIPNAVNQSIADLSFPTGPNGDPSNKATPTIGTATGLVSAGRVAFGQYSGSFGYKARIKGNLVASFNILVRFDNNGLVARTVPFYGLSYTFK